MGIVGLDVDGTLVPGRSGEWATEASPGAQEALERLRAAGHTLFVASNQSGPTWRALLNNPRYPSPAEIAARLGTVATTFGLEHSLWLVAIHPGTTRNLAVPDELLREVAAELSAELAALGIWPVFRGNVFAPIVLTGPAARKPGPRMLTGARHILTDGLTPAAYVGDQQDDAIAAVAAGFRFVSAVAWRDGADPFATRSR